MVRIVKSLFMLSLLVGSVASAATYYVAPSTGFPAGNDSAAGDINHPWLTWGKAFRTAQPGDTVFFRGGTYNIEIKNGRGIRYSPSDGMGYDGTANNPICYFNYPGEVPVLDCSSASATYDGVYNYGLWLNGVDYVHLKGLRIANVLQVPSPLGVVADVCMGLWADYCNHLKLENIEIYNINGYAFRIVRSYYAEVINCDAHDCCDYYHETLPGNWGAGFGGGNSTFSNGYTYYYGCRAWRCSDQGFCASGSVSPVVFENCWSFNNGNSIGGGGLGFKLGYWNDAPDPAVNPQIVVKNCITAFNSGSGLTGNENDQTYAGSYQLYNNIAYKNRCHGITIRETKSTENEEYKRVARNNIAYANAINGSPTYSDFHLQGIGTVYTHSNNSWDTGMPLVSDADFITVDSTGISGSRKPDGSLPDINFLKLAQSSDLIDAGISVGLVYNGNAPDLGWCETSSSTSVPLPVYLSSTVQDATPARLEMTYNLSLANIVPAASAFAVRVNSTSRTVTAVSVSGTKVFLTLASPVVFGDVVTVAYTKPASNQLQTSAGGQAATFTAQNVINNCTIPGNQPPIINISSPTKSNSYIAPANITIDVTASDPDGSVSRVEFWTDNVKLGESTTAPYSFVWKEVPEGTYSITAAVIDNQNLKTVSGAVSVIVEKSANVTNQLPVVKISLPNNNKKYKKNEKILIEVIATDADGSINKVELKNGETTIVEMTTTPYIFSWEPAETGTYFISAIATDNQGATNSSTDLELIVENLTDPNAFTVSLYPNPNDGRFTIEFPVYDNDISRKISIITLTGKRVYEAIVEPESYLKEIDVSGSIPGTYIIMISDNSGVVMTQKFIKY